MKQILTLLLLAAVFAACSDEKESVGPGGKDAVISFETTEGLIGNGGVSVVLGDAEIWNGATTVSHSNLFWAKGYAQQGFYDGVLCTTADGSVKIGSYYSYDANWGDAWGGFALSANYLQTPVGAGDFSKQFSAWAEKGANGSATCMIGYDGSYTDGPEYALPTIRFTQPRAVNYVYMANTAITYSYAPVNVDAKDYYYKIVIIGSADGVETGRTECVLVNGASHLDDWKRVDLKLLGRVDRLTFKPETNDKNNYGPVAPAYFALDDLCLRADN